MPGKVRVPLPHLHRDEAALGRYFQMHMPRIWILTATQ